MEEKTQEDIAPQVRQEKGPDGGEADLAMPKQHAETMYTGQVELIVSPAKLNMLTQLYDYLQTISELRTLYVVGSWKNGTTIGVLLERPIALASVLLKLPGAEVEPEIPQKDGPVKGMLGSLLREKSSVVRRIKVSLNEV